MRLKGKTAIITGAANGLGAATAELFAAEGANVIVTDWSVDKGVAVADEIVAAGRGSIVNVSSVSGLVGLPWIHMGYNAAKGAVRLATKAAAVQFAADGIRVNSVHPGMMPAMTTAMLSGDPEARKERIAGVPIQRVARCEEVAYANLFLASDEASYITGVELPVDGGWTAQ